MLVLWLALAAHAAPHALTARSIAGWDVDDGTDRLEVDRGRRDGVVETDAVLRVWRQGEDQLPVEIGTARIEEVGRKTTMVRVYPKDGGDSLIGDYVVLLADTPEPEGGKFAWELAAGQVELRTNDGDVISDWAMYRKGRGPTDEEACRAVADEVHEGAASFAADPESDQVLEHGRWPGKRPSEAMAALTPEEACEGLAYLLDLAPEIFVGDDQTAYAIVGAWVASGGYMPEREMRRRGEAASDDELRELIARHGTDDQYASDWMTQVRHAGEYGPRETIAALAALLERYAAQSGVAEDLARARWARAYLRQSQGDLAGALADLDEALTLLPSRRGLLLADRAWFLQRSGQAEEALASFAAAAAGGSLYDRWEYYGDGLAGASRHEEAKTAYEACIAYHDGVPSRLENAMNRNWCRLGLARSMNALGQHQEALPVWEAVERDAELYGQSSVLADAQYGHAVALSRRGRTKEAASLAIDAANAYYALGDATNAATAARSVATAYVQIGNPGEARVMLQWAIEQLRPTDDVVSLTVTLTDLARVEWFVGDPSSSLALLTEALALASDNDALRAYVLNIRGSVLGDLGRDEEAVAAYTAALESGAPDAITLDARIGRAALIRDRAELERAIALAGELRAPESEAIARLALARVMRLEGDLDGAIEEWKRAEAVARASGSSYYAADALRLIGLAELDRGRPGDAVPYLLEAKTTHKDLLDEPYGRHEALIAYETAILLRDGPTRELDALVPAHIEWIDGMGVLSGREAQPRVILARLYLRRGDVDRAAATADQARREATRADDRAAEGAARTLLAEIHLLRGDPGAAVREAEGAIAVVRTEQRAADELVDALEMLAVAKLAAGDTEGALTAAEAALSEVPGSFRGRVRARVVRGRALALLGDAAAGRAELEAAVATSGRRVDPSHRDEARVALAEHLLSLGDVEGAERALAAVERPPEQDRPLQIAVDRARAHVLAARRDPAAERLLASAEDRARALARRVRTGAAGSWRDSLLDLDARAPGIAARAAVPPEDLEALQRDLLPGEAIVLPVVLSDRIVLFVARGGAAAPSWKEVTVGEARVNGLVAEMRDALQAPADPWQPSRGAKLVLASKADPTVAARSLHDLLIAPIASDLEGVETVIFAPEGRLRYVPFAALYDGERYLVERFAVSLLTASGSTTTHRPVDRGAKLLALSNPDGSLPGASAEAVAIARTWGRRRTVAHDGAAATEDQLRADLDGVSLLHLATHGVLRSDAPRESYLLFAADSHLTVREITLLPLENIDLAVLSACETAVGDQGEGREIAGLAYQLEVRGAAAVVASLWAVNDEGTSRLMSDLYGNLAKRRARTEALREAQLAMLRDPELRHPYYWAPFVLIGDWR